MRPIQVTSPAIYGYGYCCLLLLLLALWAPASSAKFDYQANDDFVQLYRYLNRHPIRVLDAPSVAKLIARLEANSRLKSEAGLGRALALLKRLASPAPCNAERLEAIRFAMDNENPNLTNVVQLIRYLASQASWQCLEALAAEAQLRAQHVGPSLAEDGGALRRGLLNATVWNLAASYTPAPNYNLDRLTAKLLEDTTGFYTYPEQAALALIEITRPQWPADKQQSYQAMAGLVLENFDSLYRAKLIEPCQQQQRALEEVYQVARYMGQLVERRALHTLVGDMAAGLKEQLVLYGLCGSLERGRLHQPLAVRLRQSLERVAELGFDAGLQPFVWAATSTTEAPAAAQ